MRRHKMLLALSASLLAVFGSACDGASYVQELNIENPTDYNLQVDVGREGSSSRLQLGNVGKDSIGVREEVLDFGDRWTFGFRYQGEEAGSVSVDRQQLEEDGWTLVIPEDVGNRLKDNGVPPSF